MKFFHNIKLSVIIKPEESNFTESKVKELFEKVSGLDLSKDKIKFNKEIVEGFDQRKISIYSIELIKENHTNRFIDSILLQIGKKQITKILEQLDSRVDENLKFYLRLDKNKILDNIYEVIESGNCLHITMSVAAFPKNIVVAKSIVSKVLSERL